MRTRTIGSPIGQTIPTLQNPRCQWVFASEPNDNASTASTGYAEAGRTCEMIPYYAATRELSRDVWAVQRLPGPRHPWFQNLLRLIFRVTGWLYQENSAGSI